MECHKVALEVGVPLGIMLGISLIVNIVSCCHLHKYRKEELKRRKRVLQVKQARQRKKKRFSEKNLEYEAYKQREKSSIPEWAYNQYMDEGV